MSSCCSTNPQGLKGASACPVSGTVGKLVELLTVKGLLREPALRRLDSLDHYFCSDPACDVVYFNGAGATYARGDLRVPVWEKELPGARTICYCFGENEADMLRECQQQGSSAAVARIRAHIQAGRCACEIRNPRGVCCLGDVIAAVERARQSAREVAK
jgi:hypothetical protein